MGRGCNPQKRIGGANARCESLAIDIRLEAIAQEPSVAVVNLIEAGNGRSGVCKGFTRAGTRGPKPCGAHVRSGSDRAEWAMGPSEHITNRSQRSRISPSID